MYTCTYILYIYSTIWASLVTQLVENPPALQETWIRSLGWEDPLEEGLATHSSLLAWRTPWTEEPGGLRPMGSQEWDTTERLRTAQLYVCRYCSVVRSRLALLWSHEAHWPPLSMSSPHKNTGVGCHFFLHALYTHTHTYKCSVIYHCIEAYTLHFVIENCMISPASLMSPVCWQVGSLPLAPAQKPIYYRKLYYIATCINIYMFSL